VRTLFDFSEAATARRWHPLNDRVMGGVSLGALEATTEGVRFFGEVSFERNGGFASVRAPIEPIDLSAAEGLELVVRGDGKRYKVNFHSQTDPSSMLHRASFETLDAEWETVRVRFDQFVPTVRGRAVRVQSAGRAAIDSFGLMISDRQEGPFCLELKSIEAF
jgi:hypothetical protein